MKYFKMEEQYSVLQKMWYRDKKRGAVLPKMWSESKGNGFGTLFQWETGIAEI